MKARCMCTMQQTTLGAWEKPASGYKDPDPTCERCGGTGFLEVHFPDEDELEAVWIGRCPECGSENGIYLQRKGQPPPENDPEGWPGLPSCMNENCPQQEVEWVRTEEDLPRGELN